MLEKKIKIIAFNLETMNSSKLFMQSAIFKFICVFLPGRDFSS